MLLETLTRPLRAVDPAALGGVAHFLPALHFAFNVEGDAVSTDFDPLAGTERHAVDHHLDPPRAAVAPRDVAAGVRRARPRPAVAARAPVAGRRVPGRGRGHPDGRPLARAGGAADALPRRRDRAEHPHAGAALRPRQRCRWRPSSSASRPSVAAAPGAAGLRRAVESRPHFLRLLALQPVATPTGDAFIKAYAVPALDAARRARLDAETLRSPISSPAAPSTHAALRAALDAGGIAALDPALQIRAADRAEVEAACHGLDDLVRHAVQRAGAQAQDAWQRDRMEYAFSVAARALRRCFGERTLSAAEYFDGPLDWHAFDLERRSQRWGPRPTGRGEVMRTVIPAPVSFRGMPAAALLGVRGRADRRRLVQAGPTDLPHLLLVEYATVYGNDWFVIPIDLPVGSLTESRSLVVTDTFGVRTLLRPHGDPRPAAGAVEHVPALARRRPGGAARTAARNLFFLPPSVAQTLEGATLEELLLLRDEMANMAWAIERRRREPAGGRARAGQRRRRRGGAGRGAVGVPAPAYRLASATPPHWVPLLPVRVDADGREVRLARAATLAPDGSRRLVRAEGRLLIDPAGPRRAPADPRGGSPARGRPRAPHLPGARWLDGRLVVWAGHRKTSGAGRDRAGSRSTRSSSSAVKRRTRAGAERRRRHGRLFTRGVTPKAAVRKLALSRVLSPFWPASTSSRCRHAKQTRRTSLSPAQGDEHEGGGLDVMLVQILAAPPGK